MCNSNVMRAKKMIFIMTNEERQKKKTKKKQFGVKKIQPQK